MRTKKQIKKCLEDFKKELEVDDNEEDVDKKLPCCDYRELEVSISILNWVLNEN